MEKQKNIQLACELLQVTCFEGITYIIVVLFYFIDKTASTHWKISE